MYEEINKVINKELSNMELPGKGSLFFEKIFYFLI